MIRLRLLALLFALAACWAAPALAADDTLAVRQVYAEVNAKFGAMKTRRFAAHRPDVAYTSEVEAWSDEGGLRKLVVTDADGDGDVVGEYYFAGGALVFYFGTVKGFTEQGRQVAREEDRQYFQGGRMFKWLRGMGEAKESLAPNSPEFAAEAKRRLAAAAFFATAAQKPAPAGKAPPPLAGTLLRLEAGDVACYLALRDEAGKERTVLAEFELCEEGVGLKGKKVLLGFTMAQVLDPSCNGNPDCGKTRQAPVANSLKALRP